MQEQYFRINRTKAEAPLYAIFVISCVIVFLTVFSLGFIVLISLGLLLSTIFVIVRKKLAGRYYIKVCDEGIEFRTGIFRKRAFLPWDFVNQVNFHLYEVNLRLKETNRVINIQTNYLDKEEIENFIEIVKIKFKKASKPTLI